MNKKLNGMFKVLENIYYKYLDTKMYIEESRKEKT